MWPFLLMCVSRDVRRIDFPQVDRWSTDTPGEGHHSAGAPLIISDLPSSHRLWKEHYFFVSGRSWEYDPLDKDDTLGVSAAWTTPENLREHRFGLIWSIFLKL